MKRLFALAAAMTREKHGFIIDHSTGDHPRSGEIDTPIIYGDYYYLEALMLQ